MRKLITGLSHFGFARRLVQTLGFHHVANWYLQRFPLIKVMPVSGIKYRAVRVESIPLGAEMLEEGKTYPERSLRPDLTTFADLGCNVGYFACLLSHATRNRSLCGLMIDANPQAVEEAKWHAQANGLVNVFALHGMVGEPSLTREANFHVYASNICSAAQPLLTRQFHLPGKWTRIKVPCLSVEEIWRQKFGNTRCQLLKVDVEGSELNFLQSETNFLRLVDSILLEWHKWRVDLPEVKRLLKEQGFRLIEVLEEDENLGTALFRRNEIGRSDVQNTGPAPA